MIGSDISPGDTVLCIVDCNENSPGVLAHWLCGAEIVAGQQYTVLEVVRDVDQEHEEGTGLILVESDTHWPRSRDGALGAWHIRHFATLSKATAAVLRQTEQVRP